MHIASDFNMLTVSNAGIEQFKNILKDKSQLRLFFIDHHKAVVFLNALSASEVGKDLAASALSEDDIIYELSKKGHAAEISKILDNMTTKQHKKVLSASNAILGLTRFWQSGKLMEMLNKMDNDQLLEKLSYPEVVFELTQKGHAADIIKIANERMDVNQKVKLFSTPKAILGLSINGYDQYVMDFISGKDISIKQRTSLLSAEYAVKGLTSKGHDKTIFIILDNTDQEGCTDILSAKSAILGLVTNSDRSRRKVINLISKLNNTQRRTIFSSDVTVATLTHFYRNQELEIMLNEAGINYTHRSDRQYSDKHMP